MRGLVFVVACSEASDQTGAGGSGGTGGSAGSGGFDSSRCDEEPGRGPFDTLDFSSFSMFVFSRETAACDHDYPPEEIFSAEINKVGAEEYLLSYSILEDPGGMETCFVTYSCVLRTFEARALSVDEISKVLGEFGEVGVAAKYMCDCYIDPCTVNRFDWDGEMHSDYVCEPEFLRGGSGARIIELLNSLTLGAD